jgi:hypothetical protein
MRTVHQIHPLDALTRDRHALFAPCVQQGLNDLRKLLRILGLEVFDTKQVRLISTLLSAPFLSVPYRGCHKRVSNIKGTLGLDGVGVFGIVTTGSA